MASSNLEQFIVNTADQARQGTDATKKNAQGSSRPSIIRRAIISADNGNGSYSVGIVGANGATVDSIPGVRPWGSGATYNVNDRVFIVYEGDRPIPFILGAEGGGGSGSESTVLTGYIRFFS